MFASANNVAGSSMVHASPSATCHAPAASTCARSPTPRCHTEIQVTIVPAPGAAHIGQYAFLSYSTSLSPLALAHFNTATCLTCPSRPLVPRYPHRRRLTCPNPRSVLAKETIKPTRLRTAAHPCGSSQCALHALLTPHIVFVRCDPSDYSCLLSPPMQTTEPQVVLLYHSYVPLLPVNCTICTCKLYHACL
jgi:hypothetical protein